MYGFLEKHSKPPPLVKWAMSKDTINLDHPRVYYMYVLLPDWVFDQIAQTEAYTIADVFPSQHLSDYDARKCHSLYPITAFCLVQLQAGKTGRQWFQLQTLIRQHEQFQVDHTKDPVEGTYRTTITDLVDVGILKRRKEDGSVLYGLPDDVDVDPAFDRTHPDNILDQITMDDPDPREEVETTLWPRPDTTDRPAVIPAQLAGDQLSNPWDAGISFLTIGVALTTLSVGLISMGDGTVTGSLAAALWAVFSIGIAAALVEILDQLKAGYQYTD